MGQCLYETTLTGRTSAIKIKTNILSLALDSAYTASQPAIIPAFTEKTGKPNNNSSGELTLQHFLLLTFSHRKWKSLTSRF